MNIPSFDTLNLDKNFDNDIVWEGKLSVGDSSVDAALWVTNADALNPQRLNKIATQCQNIATLSDKALIALNQYLTKDDEFITFHLENLEVGAVPKLDALRPDSSNPAQTDKDKDKDKPNLTISPEAFVEILYLHSISIWITSDTLEGNTIWLDYMLDAEHSDQILTVHFNLDGKLTEVVWES